uniref:Replication-associated protein n=1 Tax=Circoviridae sp. TaxID=1954248 RepID=A0A6M3YTK0_9VIRU|nr:MAG: replication-associated protein [Circoviridae sp.]QJI53404.1 MAG: replication-associated protein [Circoviridae sp.]QJI53406.1 MAG: replication-associated protein [Circoviridae sp.]
MSYASKRYVFTINNPQFEDYCAVLEFLTEQNCVFAVCGEERGEQGTPHLQGFVNLRKKMRPAAVEENLGGRAWLSRAKGTDEDNDDYCTKESTYHRVGEPQKQGARSDLKKVAALVDEGASLTEVARKYPSQFIMYGRGIQMYAHVTRDIERDWKTEVIVVIGPPGCGKSRFAAEYPCTRKYYKSRGLWWDGYDGHDVVVMDDYYGWLPYCDLLRLCDRYPLRVEYKGGMCQFSAKVIIITSNKHPNEWYKSELDISAMYRRITRYLYWDTQDLVDIPEIMLPHKINY